MRCPRTTARTQKKYHKGTRADLQEALVLLFRFAKFYEMMKKSKSVASSSKYKKLQRDLLAMVASFNKVYPGSVDFVEGEGTEGHPCMEGNPFMEHPLMEGHHPSMIPPC